MTKTMLFIVSDDFPMILFISKVNKHFAVPCYSTHVFLSNFQEHIIINFGNIFTLDLLFQCDPFNG